MYFYKYIELSYLITQSYYWQPLHPVFLKFFFIPVQTFKSFYRKAYKLILSIYLMH